MDAGVDDYLVKPFDDLELKARLFAGRRVLLLQSELIDAHDKLQFVASHDSLTGVMNRREIIDALLREMARSKRERSPLAVAMVDVDHFKAVNDELGHLFGDHALKEVAQRLHAKLRVYDSVGRYGGEEFLLVFPGCDLTNMLVRMDEVRSFVSRSPLSAMGKHRLLTISIGVAVFDGETPIEVETLLHQADMSLYEAKRKGRNRVEHLEPQRGHAVPTPASSSAVFERTIQ
jgi:diguanylate cyclase (GGDEF)-like protein